MTEKKCQKKNQQHDRTSLRSVYLTFPTAEFLKFPSFLIKVTCVANDNSEHSEQQRNLSASFSGAVWIINVNKELLYISVYKQTLVMHNSVCACNAIPALGHRFCY